ncbi:MAG: hypothetical protein V3R96_00435 [Dehalococcoidales bacterium]
MRKKIVITSLCLILGLAVTSACTPSEVEQLEGILQSVDAAKGEITIVTNDGQTVTYKVDSGASVDTDEASTLDTLEVGAFVQIEVDEESQVVQAIKEPQSEEETVEEEDETTVNSGEDNRENAAEVRSPSDDGKEAGEGDANGQTISGDDNESPGGSNGSQDGTDDGDGSGQNTPTGPTEPPDDVPVTVPDGGRVVSIILGTILKIEGGFWTIIDENDVIWVVDVNNIDLPDDTVVGGKITLSAIFYDDNLVAGEAEVYPDEGGDVDHISDNGEVVHPDDDHLDDDHPDDGEGDHPDDGDDDHPDDGEDDHGE